MPRITQSVALLIISILCSSCIATGFKEEDREHREGFWCNYYGTCEKEEEASCALHGNCKEEKTASCALWGNCNDAVSDKVSPECSLWGNCKDESNKSGVSAEQNNCSFYGTCDQSNRPRTNDASSSSAGGDMSSGW